MNMRERNDQELAASGHLFEDSVALSPAVGRFVATVDALVDERLTGDEVEARLEWVRRDAECSTPAGAEWGLENPNWRGFARELAQYGYDTVQTWLRIVLVWIRAVSAIGGQWADLTEDDIDELAQDTVARAINSFRDEARRCGRWPSDDTIELRTTFLAQCVRQLPHAYRSRLLKTGRLPVDRLEELAGNPVEVLVVRALRHCMTDWRDHTAHLLRSWGYTGQENDEIIDMTMSGLDLAAARYAELGDLHTTTPAHDDQAVER